MKKIALVIVLFFSTLSFMSMTNFKLNEKQTTIEVVKTSQIAVNEEVTQPTDNEKTFQSTVNQKLTEQEMKELSKSINVNLIENTPPLSPTEIVKYLLSLLGTFITSLILIFLNKKFPQWFPSPNKNKYN